MSDPGKLVWIRDYNLKEVMEAERAALIFTKSSCGNCAAYQAEIEDLLERGEMKGITIGKVVLDQRGITGYKRENPWLSGLRFLPYTLLYRKGLQVDGFAASKGTYLLERIETTFAGTLALAAEA
jgi:hypothetical protein